MSAPYAVDYDNVWLQGRVNYLAGCYCAYWMEPGNVPGVREHLRPGSKLVDDYHGLFEKLIDPANKDVYWDDITYSEDLDGMIHFHKTVAPADNGTNFPAEIAGFFIDKRDFGDLFIALCEAHGFAHG